MDAALFDVAAVTPLKDSTLSVLSLNVLCAASATPRFFATGNDDSVLAFEQRRLKIARIVANANADVIALQEMWSGQEYPGYKCLFKRRTNKDDGCAILWREDRFLLLRHDFQDMDQIVYAGGFNKPPVMTCNTGLFCVLRDRVTARLLLIANVQLFWNRTNIAVQANQVQLFLESLYQLKHPDDMPIFVCGDLACEPNSPPVELVQRSLSPRAYGKLHSAYPTGEGLKTVCEKLRREPVSEDAMVDYIFHSEHVEVVSRRPLPKSFDPVPSESWPSNHALLLVDFKLKPTYDPPTVPNVVLAQPLIKRTVDVEVTPPPRASNPTTPWQKKIPCKFYPSNSCTMGSNCPFSHVKRSLNPTAVEFRPPAYK